MARCKCQICKIELDSKTAFKITDKNGKNKYFCSQSEYELEEQRKKKAAEDKDKVYRLICDIMKTPEIISTALFKEWQVWLKVADNEKIAKYLAENKDYLSGLISRLQNSEFAKIRYLSAIIKDKIKEFVPKAEAEKPRIVEVDMTLYDAAPSGIRNNRRSLADLEDEI